MTGGDEPGMSGPPDALQRLWTPWRRSYVRGEDNRSGGCPFCELPGGSTDDAETLILHRGEQAYVILNAYPYNPGHLMIVPFGHLPDLDDLDRDQLHEMADLSQRAVRALRASVAPEAFNIGFNLGGVAGAGIADHLHQHVVPRWAGDTNFMPVIGHTRVLPELLEETYGRLAPAFADA